jgi:hypothetical protein
MADNTFEAGYNAAISDLVNFITEEIERITSTRFPSDEVLSYLDGLVSIIEGGHF